MRADMCHSANAKTEIELDFDVFKKGIEDGSLKEEINQLIFTKGNPYWTIHQAEQAARKIYDILIEGVLE